MSKTLKTLVIDNNRDDDAKGAPDLIRCVIRAAPAGSPILVRRAPDSDLPPIDEKFDAIIISGSSTSCLQMHEPWIAPYDQFLAAHIERNTPILGVCYGHQTIARYLFRRAGQAPKLAKASHAEHGWAEVSATRKNPLFAGLASPFYTYHSHYEEVAALPPGADRVC